MSITLADAIGGAPAPSLTLASNCAVGDLIVTFYDNSSYVTITDSANTGNYAQPSSCQALAANGTTDLAMAYMVCNANSSTPPTVTFGAGVANAQIGRFTGFTGTATLDSGSPSFLNGTGVVTLTNSSTTAHANEMAVGFGWTNNAKTSGAPTGWTTLNSSEGSLVAAYYEAVASAGSFSMVTDYSASSNVTSFVAAFYDATSTPTNKGQFFFADALGSPRKIAAASMMGALTWIVNRRNTLKQSQRVHRTRTSR